MARLSLEELKSIGLGHGAFDLGYGPVAAGDIVEDGVHEYHTGQVLEVFHDGDLWVQWDDLPGTQTLKWRYVRRLF
jgi:hypothetical protein